MKKYLFPGLLAGLCLSVSLPASAQDVRRTKEYNNAITVQPLYLINSGIRMDYDRRIRDRQWLQTSVIGYRSEGSEFFEFWMLDDAYDTKTTGMGVELNYHYYPFRRVKFIYVSAGVSYSHFNVDYSGVGYGQYVEDGLTFYEPVKETFTQRFDRVETSARIAIQSHPRRRFFIDFYVGVGYRHSFYNETQFHPNYLMSHLGYRGPVLITGFRIGTRF